MTEQTRRFDLVAVGRSCIDLYGQQLGGRLEDMQSFAKYIGGSPTNTAVGASRLGLRSALVSRVGNDHFGRFILEQLDREGVATEGVIADDARLTALVFLGIRDAQTFPLIFYRENCADMALGVADIDAKMLQSTRAVLINGTHLSRPNVFDASVQAARMAREAGARVVFDVDYRPVLWGLAGKDRGEDRFVADAEVTARLQQVLPLCDLIVGTEEEMHILGGHTDSLDALRAIRAQSNALLVCKRGELGCVAFPGTIPDHLDGGVVGRGFRIEVFNVLGAGDAFMAGFLRGWLRDESIETCCSYGNACGALVVSRHGCAPAMPSWEELTTYLARNDWPLRLRDADQLQHLHRVTTRTQEYPDLTVLAMDHRSQFEDLCAAIGASLERLPAFKALTLAAVDKVAGGNRGFGVLLDGRFGWRGLELAADSPYWIGRPIEAPGSRPLLFEASADVATELATWPANHVVKCLVHYHPDDEAELRAAQVRQMQRLQDACRKTNHELLLEVIASKHGRIDEHTAERALAQLYDAGLQPDWWKLEPTTPAGWEHIGRLLQQRDPWCRGVLVLGLHAPIDELAASLRIAAQSPVVKGFAVGRTIFAEPAERWLRGQIDDATAVGELAERFAVLVAAWREGRVGAPAALREGRA